MSDEYRKRMAQFVSKYADVTDCKIGYGDDRVIRGVISLLVKGNIFTPLQLQKQALKDNSVMIPLPFIRECSGR